MFRDFNIVHSTAITPVTYDVSFDAILQMKDDGAVDARWPDGMIVWNNFVTVPVKRASQRSPYNTTGDPFLHDAYYPSLVVELPIDDHMNYIKTEAIKRAVAESAPSEEESEQALW